MALLAEGILKLHWDQTVPVNVAHIVKQMGVGLQLQDTLATNAQLTITPDNRATITLNRQLPLHCNAMPWPMRWAMSLCTTCALV